MPSEKQSAPSIGRSNSRISRILITLGIVVLLFVLINVWFYQKLVAPALRPLQLPPLDLVYKGEQCPHIKEPGTRVAIIGAGAAGASTAYYLSLSAPLCSPFNVTIFESQPYVGGRSTTINLYDDPNSASVELGASIFVEANRNLMSAAHNLNLSFNEPYDIPADLKYDTGIWDGTEWRFLIEQDEPSWKLIPRLIWRYGTSPFRLQGLKNDVINRFLKMYEWPVFPFRFLNDAVRDLDLERVTRRKGVDILLANGIGVDFARDIVQASTRVNYASNLDEIHGLETLVSMAADGGAKSIDGGNWQIFSAMIDDSGASLLLNTSVTSISRREEDGAFEVSWKDAAHDASSTQVNSSASGGEGVFNVVVLAAPWHQSKVEIMPQPRNAPPEVEYRKLYVTIFTSRHRLRRAYWGQMKDQVPGTVLTTSAGDLIPEAHSPDYLSISVLRSTINPITEELEIAYKIFSLAPLSDSWLKKILDAPVRNDINDTVSWIYRKVWLSYPVLHPTSTFYGPEMIFDGIDHEETGFWYTSGMEPFISTMETSSLAGKNVAVLIAGSVSSTTEPIKVQRETDDSRYLRDCPNPMEKAKTEL